MGTMMSHFLANKNGPSTRPEPARGEQRAFWPGALRLDRPHLPCCPSPRLDAVQRPTCSQAATVLSPPLWPIPRELKAAWGDEGEGATGSKRRMKQDSSWLLSSKMSTKKMRVKELVSLRGGHTWALNTILPTLCLETSAK